MRIDAHQHFWRYNREEYGWIDDTMADIKRDFLPEDLQPLIAQAGLDGVVSVQARQSLAETEWLLFLAGQNDFIKGVVGWVDLQSPNVEAQLSTYAKDAKLKGIRHVVHDEPDDEFMLRPAFLYGLGALHQFNLAYDLLLFPRHLPIAIDVVKRFPNQKFVLDHIAKPLIKDQVLSPWREYIRELAAWGNVWCKVSGMVTEAVWKAWQPQDFRPYLDVIFECFGPDRLMFGSDWPVCITAAGYPQVFSIVRVYIEQFSTPDQEKILGGTASSFYGIKLA